MYCFALLCFALLCFALLQITGCSAGPPRSDLRWLLYSIRTAWLDTYLAPVWPAHHQALALSRAVPQHSKCLSRLAVPKQNAHRRHHPKTGARGVPQCTHYGHQLNLHSPSPGARKLEGRCYRSSLEEGTRQCRTNSTEVLKRCGIFPASISAPSNISSAIVEKCPPPCDLRQTRLSNSARTPRIGLSILQGIFLHTLSQWPPRRISNTLPLSNLV
jgi:hypothetical protein